MLGDSPLHDELPLDDADAWVQKSTATDVAFRAPTDARKEDEAPMPPASQKSVVSLLAKRPESSVTFDDVP